MGIKPNSKPENVLAYLCFLGYVWSEEQYEDAELERLLEAFMDPYG